MKATLFHIFMLPRSFGVLLKRVVIAYGIYRLTQLAAFFGLLKFLGLVTVALLDWRWRLTGVAAPVVIFCAAYAGLKASQRGESGLAESLFWLSRLTAIATMVVTVLAAGQHGSDSETWVFLVPFIGFYLLVASFRALNSQARLDEFYGNAGLVAQDLSGRTPHVSNLSQVSQVPQVPQVQQAEPARPGDTVTLDLQPASVPTLTLANVAGMADLKRDLAEFITAFRGLRDARVLPDRNGLLLSGPPGNGKTMVATAVAGELGLPLLKLGIEDLASRWLGEGQQKIKAMFDIAKECAPCVLFLDEVEAIAPSRSESNLNNETAKNVNALLTGIDSLRGHKVVLIAATNFYEKLDAAVIRDGRFDFKIEIPYADLAARVAIIAGLVAKHKLAVEPSVQMDLAAHWVERSASFMDGAFKRVRDVPANGRGSISLGDVKAAGRKASRRESAIPRDCPGVADMFLTAETRRDIDGLLYRMKNWESVVARGGSAPKGILFYGPPGTGKTSLARAMVKTLGDWHIFEVKTAEVLADPRVFKDAIGQAKQHRPAVIFLDEADELLRDRVHSPSATATNEILKSMDGMMATVPEVVFIAATNNAEAIDAAALRGGRFADRLFLGLFKGACLVHYVRSELTKRPGLRLNHSVTAELIAEAIGQAGPADVNAIISQAVNYTLTSGQQRSVNMADFSRAVATMQR